MFATWNLGIEGSLVSNNDCLSLLRLLLELSVSGGLPIPAIVCCTVMGRYVVSCCLLANSVPYSLVVVSGDAVLDDADGVGDDVDVLKDVHLLAMGIRGSCIDLASCSVDCFLKNYHCL